MSDNTETLAVRAAIASGPGSTGTTGAAMRASATNDKEYKNVMLALSVTGRGRNNLRHAV